MFPFNVAAILQKDKIFAETQIAQILKNTLGMASICFAERLQ
jgi:hypothetical protein